MPTIDRAGQKTLLRLARESIAAGLSHGKPCPPDSERYKSLGQIRCGVFVTLHVQGKLRGCIGCLEAEHSLPEAVAECAHGAAFRDSRFDPVSAAELPDIDIEISLLSEAESLQFISEDDALSQLRPGLDGIILEAQGRRATFLPVVWQQLAEPADFLRHLKQKAGLDASYWSENLRLQRYSSQSFSESGLHNDHPQG